MRLHPGSSDRKATRYSFVAKQQVCVGEDISAASSHSPRHWMWHGNGQTRLDRVRLRFSGDVSVLAVKASQPLRLN